MDYPRGLRLMASKKNGAMAVKPESPSEIGATPFGKGFAKEADVAFKKVSAQGLDIQPEDDDEVSSVSNSLLRDALEQMVPWPEVRARYLALYGNKALAAAVQDAKGFEAGLSNHPYLLAYPSHAAKEMKKASRTLKDLLKKDKEDDGDE